VKPLSGSAGGIDEAERAGIELSSAREVDGIVYLVPPPWRLEAVDEAFLASRPAECTLLTGSLCDLSPGPPPWPGALRLSPLTGEGIGELKRSILVRWLDSAGFLAAGAPSSAFTRRQAAQLERMLSALRPQGTPDLDVLREAYVECLRHFPTQ